MKQYLDLAKRILNEGIETGDRTGTGTISLFGPQLEFDLSEGFPLLTTKKLSFKNIVTELLWIISGDTNIHKLNQQGNRIWNDWPYAKYCANPTETVETEEGGRLYTLKEFGIRCGEDLEFSKRFGDLGPVYGKQWRRWESSRTGQEIDQLLRLIDDLRRNPFSRRHIVSAWKVDEIDDMALPPCHCFFQLKVYPASLEQRIRWVMDNVELDLENLAITEYANSDKAPQYSLHLKLYQRSADYFLGVPYNIASYSLLLELLCRELNYIPGKFIHSFGDVHIYKNHVEQMREQISREPKPTPGLFVRKSKKSLFELIPEDIELDHYEPWPSIKGDVSV